MFLGDHTSPDNPGFLRVLGDVLGRFHSELHLNLISAGSSGQTAAGLTSRALLDLLMSSSPDWLVINVGLADALREPGLERLLSRYRALAAQADEENDALGPEHHVRESSLGPRSDSGVLRETEWARLSIFKSHLADAVRELTGAGIRCILVTTIAVGGNLQHPLNLALKAYSRAIREVATAAGAPVVDVERAFRDVLERATNYKQKVSLADERGEVNQQGQALLARTFLGAFHLLPNPGQRSS